MRSSLKQLMAATLALAAMGSMAPTQTIETATAAQEKEARDKMDAANREALTESSKRRQGYRPLSIGGVPVINIGGGGIPPQVYGERYVKRGTHKKTNKRR